MLPEEESEQVGLDHKKVAVREQEDLGETWACEALQQVEFLVPFVKIVPGKI